MRMDLIYVCMKFLGDCAHTQCVRFLINEGVNEEDSALSNEQSELQDSLQRCSNPLPTFCPYCHPAAGHCELPRCLWGHRGNKADWSLLCGLESQLPCARGNVGASESSEHTGLFSSKEDCRPETVNLHPLPSFVSQLPSPFRLSLPL